MRCLRPLHRRSVSSWPVSFRSSSSTSRHLSSLGVGFSLQPNDGLFRSNIFEIGLKVLKSDDPKAKARMTVDFALTVLGASSKPSFLSFQESGILEIPMAPTRSVGVKIVSAQENPSARQLGVSPLVWLLHSLAHIEMNAVELTWDTILRFHHKTDPAFLADFLSIANDEARHFEFLTERLAHHGSYYGAIPAHAGLWQAAEKTTTDLLGRLSAIQLVQEPRALDSAERLRKKMVSYGDVKSAQLVELICHEEIGHVRIGVKWFKHFCELDGLDPVPTFHEKVRRYVGVVPPPFNEIARSAADMGSEWYLPISHRENAPKSEL